MTYQIMSNINKKLYFASLRLCSFIFHEQQEDDEVGKGKGFARISSFITNMTFCRTITLEIH